MYINKFVRLKSINGTARAPIDEPVRACDDYWKMIGWEGQVIEDENEYKKVFNIKKTDNLRVLVRFNLDIKKLGLASHNELSNENWSNSLWILIDDLEIISP